MVGIAASVELHGFVGAFADCCDLPRFVIFSLQISQAWLFCMKSAHMWKGRNIHTERPRFSPRYSSALSNAFSVLPSAVIHDVSPFALA